MVRQTTEDIYAHLIQYGWKIRDEHGRNDTSADSVSRLLRVAVLGLVHHTGATNVADEYQREFNKFMDLANTLAIADRFANIQQYYAHNLRTSRALALWLLEGDSLNGSMIADYYQSNVWKFTKGHKSAWFAFTRAALVPTDFSAVAEGIDSLRSLSLKPIRMYSSPLHGQEQKPGLPELASGCTNLYVLDPHLRKPEDYVTWQKEPWDPGPETDWDKEALGDMSGLDFMLPYWLGKAFNVF